jgi:hypothetical protein
MGMHKQFYAGEDKKYKEKSYNYYLKHSCSCKRKCCNKHGGGVGGGKSGYVKRLSIGRVCVVPHAHRTHSHRTGGAWRMTTTHPPCCYKK